MALDAGLTPGVAGVPGRGGRPQAVHDHHRAQGSRRAHDNATRVLDQSRRYIEDFDQTVAKSSTPREVIEEMLAKYPAYGNRYTLCADIVEVEGSHVIMISSRRRSPTTSSRRPGPSPARTRRRRAPHRRRARRRRK